MVDGWNAVHGSEPQPEPPTDDEFDLMLEDLAAHRAKAGSIGPQRQRHPVRKANGRPQD